MAFYINKDGVKQDVPVDVSIYQAAKAEGKTVAEHINTLYAGDVSAEHGTAFTQICASEGLTLAGENQFGFRAANLHDIFNGKAGFQAAANNAAGRSTPFGTESRTLFAAAVIAMIEDTIQPDRTSDDASFRSMVKVNVPIAGDTYEQPVVSYANAGGANNGANGAKAARVVQLGELPTMLKITTSDRFRKIPTYGIGIEMSEQAMKASTLDLFGLTVARYIQIEKDARVYQYLANIFAGDLDQNTGAIPSVTTTSLDPAATGGVVTHRAWVKFLARNRKRRKITHVVCDIDTYLKVESRTGRPGSSNYDPTLSRIDPQLTAMTGTVGFGNDVQWMIVDSAAEGGPIPSNTLWCLDKEQAIMMVSNTEADFKATEQFILRRSEVTAWHWAEEAMRMQGDAELTPFDVLVIA